MCPCPNLCKCQDYLTGPFDLWRICASPALSLQLVDYRAEFSKWWLTEFKTVKFPSQGTVFDYYIDPETKKFEPWTKLIPQFEFDPEMPLQVSRTEQLGT